MAFTAETQRDLEHTFTMEWGGETGTITYRLGQVAAWDTQSTVFAQQSQTDYEFYARRLDFILVAWDVTSHGEPVAPTFDAIMAAQPAGLNEQFLNAVLRAIRRETVPGKKIAAT